MRWMTIRLALMLFPFAIPLKAQVTLEFEGTRWQTRLNEVRKPVAGGTTFALPDLLGSDPVLTGRMNLSWNLNRKHGLRILLAPFQTSGSGQFQSPTAYRGTTFDPGVPTEGLYRFNSWRATWRYTVIQDDMWTLKLGATAKIRDAKIQVVQGAKRESDRNVGFVPLAHVWVERRFVLGWSAVFDMDALAAPQGRAVDAAVMVRRQFTPTFFADLGYRQLEGGADNDELYTWARLGTLLLLLLTAPLMATEEPSFRTLLKRESMEIRVYSPMIVAETFVEGPMDAASNRGFRLLADYIFGNNRARRGDGNLKPAMTAPVTLEPRSETLAMTAPVGIQAQGGMWRVHFVMPASHTLDSLPVPNNPQVSLRAMPEQKVAAIVFSGLANPAKVQAKTETLLAWMASQGLKPAGTPQLARYNPPWTLPPFRRNEILVPIE